MKRKSLLVEDDVSVARMHKTLLELEGFDVSSSEGEVKNLPEYINAVRPEFMILDYHLRNATAIDILKLFKFIPPEDRSYILVTSGEDQRERCRDEGADGFILKPYMPDELINWLREKELLSEQGED